MPKSTLDDIVDRCDAWAKSRRDCRADTHLGFAKLEHSLAHKKGVSDPRAVAASIGRKKLGQKEMTRRSVAGRKS